MPMSISHKDAIAIEPPKKVCRPVPRAGIGGLGADKPSHPSQVIKAVYDYAAPTDPDVYLSFSAGDFLHVVGREHDEDWYEACNPLRNERGLVPVTYFETVGKTAQGSGDSSKSISSTTHDSGFGEGA